VGFAQMPSLALLFLSKARAQAMQDVLRKMSAAQDSRRSHPAYWAPFVLIGAL
jgi:CHAT domain-containing protein